MIYVITVGLFGCLILGIPVAISLGLSALVAFFVERGGLMDFSMLAQRMMYGINSFLLVAIPLFILAARLMNTSGVTQRLFGFATTIVGFLPGGLGHANVLASLIFSGMSGNAIADAAGLGQIELKAMRDAGYDDAFAVAVTGASSTIGPIFPPSVPMVVFSLVSGVSVGRLFLGGVVPGVVMAVSLMVIVYIYALRRGYPRSPVPTFRDVRIAFGKAILPLLTPMILLGGIWIGWFTPTESAAVAVAYAIFLGAVVYRDLAMADVVTAFIETARDAAALAFIMAGAAFFGWVLMRTGTAAAIAEGLIQITTDPLLLLLLINVLLVVIGCFFETIPVIMILGPILMQVITPIGIDPVHFGIVIVLNLMIGLLTPPFGLILFVMTQVGGLSFERTTRATIPFLIPLFIVLLLITFFPPIVTWLPNLAMGK